MTKTRIDFNRDLCIGAFVCVGQDPDHFEVGDGKADLLGGEKGSDEVYVVEEDLDEDGVKRAVKAAKGCPADAINVTDVESGEELYWGFPV